MTNEQLHTKRKYTENSGIYYEIIEILTRCVIIIISENEKKG